MDILSERLIYRKFTPADLADFRSLMTNEAVMRYITGRALSKEDATDRFEQALDTGRRHPEAGFFSVRTKVEETFIGMAKFVYTKDSQAEIGYAFLPDFWGQRYASELVGGLLNYADALPHLTQLIAIVDEYNAVSARLLTNYHFIRLRPGSPAGSSVYYQLDVPFGR